MKWAVVVICMMTARIVVPAVVHRLRHRPHRLTEGTQHIVLGGMLVQGVFLAVAAAAWLLG